MNNQVLFIEIKDDEVAEYLIEMLEYRASIATERIE